MKHSIRYALVVSFLAGAVSFGSEAFNHIKSDDSVRHDAAVSLAERLAAGPRLNSPDPVITKREDLIAICYDSTAHPSRKLNAANRLQFFLDDKEAARAIYRDVGNDPSIDSHYQQMAALSFKKLTSLHRKSRGI